MTAADRPPEKKHAEQAAGIRPAGLFRDGMILQRGMPLPIWGKAEKGKAGVSLTREKVGNLPGMPDVKGMGARDAVYILESRGLKVRLKGRGKVVQQSIPAGHSTRKGMVCELVLS